VRGEERRSARSFFLSSSESKRERTDLHPLRGESVGHLVRGNDGEDLTGSGKSVS